MNLLAPEIGLLYGAMLECAASASSRRLSVMHAVAAPVLSELAASAHLTVIQGFKPMADELVHQDLQLAHGLRGLQDAIAIVPSKNKLQTLAWVAQAVRHLQPEGELLLAAQNRHGARSLEKALSTVAPIGVVARAKCRLIRFFRHAVHNPAVLQSWERSGRPAVRPEHGLWSCPGLFSWARPDPGSVLLRCYLPRSFAGTGMDLCCGYGFLATHLLASCSRIRHLHLVDAERLALAMAAKNTSAHRSRVSLHWRDATHEPLPTDLDWIVCNPPFHVARQSDADLGRAILTHACELLKTGGEIWLVANRRLAYEAVLKSRLGSVEILTQKEGYKIIRGVR